jgi:hypothetical protein
MRCPYCSHDVYASWKWLFRVHEEDGRPLSEPVWTLNYAEPETYIELVWMNCPNLDCKRLIIQGVYKRYRYEGGKPIVIRKLEWLVLPRRPMRHIDPVVLPQYANDYKQAAAILEDSPKASAALSRRILGDLLQDYGGHKQFKLSGRIDAFIKESKNPRSLRENLHYLREIADFGAHTQKYEVTGAIIDVEPVEAEWCLDVIDWLFDYYIIDPKRDEEVRLAFDEKLSKSNRKPIDPLPVDE